MTSFAGDIRGDLYNTWLSIKFELRKHLRRKRLLIVAALAILVPLIFYVYSPDTASEFAAGSLGFLGVLIIISGAMFAGDAIAGEFDKKTGLLSLPTPQKRLSIFAGKYIAALIATFIVVSIYYVITTLQIAHVYGGGRNPGRTGQIVFDCLDLQYQRGKCDVLHQQYSKTFYLIHNSWFRLFDVNNADYV